MAIFDASVSGDTLASPFGLLTGFDWNLALNAPWRRDLPAEPTAEPLGWSVDPYLAWLDWTYDHAARKGGSVELLIELNPAKFDPKDGYDKAIDWLSKMECTCRLDAGPHNWRSTFITARMPLTNVKALVEALQQPGYVWRFELASPRFIPDPQQTPVPTPASSAADGDVVVTASSTPTANGSAASSTQRRAFELMRAEARALVEAAAALARQRLSAMRPPPATRPGLGQEGPLVMAIDDFCNFGNHRLRNRLRSLWHQGRRPPAAGAGQKLPVVPTPEAPGSDGFWAGSGSETDAQRAEQTLAASGTQAAESDPHSRTPYYGQTLRLERIAQATEAEVYRRAGLLRYPTPRWSHGSAVMSVLARDASRTPAADPDGLRFARTPVNLHFVQLPEAAVLDTSGGSLAGYALDAIHRAVASSMTASRRQVVVNLSYGTHSGPHDGSSMFERAMLDLLDTYDGREIDETERFPELHIVLPAGNSHLWRTHAAQWLTPPEPVMTLGWKILPDDEGDSFLELWFDARAELEIGLRSPDGKALVVDRDKRWSKWVDTLVDSAGKAVQVMRAGVVYPRTTARGLNADCALLAVAPTRRRADFGKGDRYRGTDDGGVGNNGLPRVPMEAPAGVWTVTVRNLSQNPVHVHAWVQRHDAAPGRPRAARGHQGRQSRLMDGSCTELDARFTANGIATAVHRGGRLWTVGAMDERGLLSRYSGAGPGRDFGDRLSAADVVTTVDISENAPGRLVGGVLGHSALRLSGTSIAAAVFTRMLYDCLAAGHTMQWSNDGPAPRSRPAMAGEPEPADDFLRGSYNRLRSMQHIAKPTAC